jgi:hypothetical protein
VKNTLVWLPLLLVVLAALVLSPAVAGDPDPPQWIVVTAPELRATLQPLVALREQQGFAVTLLEAPPTIDADTATALRDRVRAIWQQRPEASYVLLVGVPQEPDAEAPPPCCVPALPGTVARMVSLHTDNGYGCDDGEVLARVPVGRFPAANVAEAAAMVRKTVAWETTSRPGTWKREFVLLAGAPSYNPIVDRVVENLAMSRLGQLDPLWAGQAIYQNPQSRFTLADDELLPRAIEYIRRGPALILYIGHSNAYGFWPCTLWLAFDRNEWAQTDFGPHGSLLFTFGCNGTQLTGKRAPSYGLTAIRNPRGPAAVIGYQDICWANMAMLSTEGLLTNLPNATAAPRLGELWLAMRRALAETPVNPFIYRTLDAVDGDPSTPEPIQRREHQEMIILLGDPALRLPAMTHEITLTVKATDAGLTVTGSVPEALAGAAGQLTLERPLTSEPPDLQPSTPDLSVEQQVARLRANHEKANQFVLDTVPLKLDERTFEKTLPWPKAFAGQELVVRVYLARAEAEGLAVQTIRSPAAKQ